MKAKKILIALGLSCVAASCFAEGALSLFTITPNLNPISVRSDSEAVVRYTVTNNAAVAVNHVTLSLGSNTTGVSIQSLDNSCASGSIAAHTTCNFNVLINGATPPDSVRPIVCEGNGAMCSTSTLADVLAVHQIKVSAAHVYLPLVAGTGNNANSVLPINTTSPYQLGTPITSSDPSFDFTANFVQTGGIFVSQDGKYLYVVGAGNATLSIISQGVNSHVIGHLTLAAGNGENPVDLNSIVVNPAGTRAYITDIDNNEVRVIDVTNKDAPQALDVNNVPAVIHLDGPSLGLAISPDASTLYVTCRGNGSTTGSVEVFNLVNDVDTLKIDLIDRRVPIRPVVSPDGTKVYISDNGSDPTTMSGVSVIDTTTDPETISSPEALNLSTSAYADGLAISPDGTHLYVILGGPSGLAIINLATMVSTTIPAVGVSAWGAAVSPDGSKLFVTDGVENKLTVVDLSKNNAVEYSPDLGGLSVVPANFVG